MPDLNLQFEYPSSDNDGLSTRYIWSTVLMDASSVGL